MKSADQQILRKLDEIYGAQSGEGVAQAFADITGEPSDNAALSSELGGKVPTSRTVNGQPLSGNVTVTGRMLDTAGAPDNGVGANGDYAFDDATKTIYGPKAAGVWPAGVVLGGSAPSGGVIGTVKLSGVMSGNIGGVEYAEGPFDPLITGYSMASGILTATYTTGLANANYFPDVAFLRTGAAQSAKVEAASEGSVAFRFYDLAGDPTDNPDIVWISIQKLSQ